MKMYLVEFIYDLCKSFTKVVTAKDRADAYKQAQGMLKTLKADDVTCVWELDDTGCAIIQ